ncbi:MAG: discoidin domain-containing protein [Cyanobacteria bacterium J06635_10]
MFKKLSALALTITSVLAATSGAAQAASLVSQIKVTSASGQWLQISEVFANEYGTGNDLALTSAGATATGTGNWNPASNPLKAIDGAGIKSYPDIYHSDGRGANEYLLVDLATPSMLESITIQGREGCCSNRDVFNLELFNEVGESIFTASNLDATGLNGHSVTVNLPKPVESTSVPEPTSMLGILALTGLGAASLKGKLAKAESAKLLA